VAVALGVAAWGAGAQPLPPYKKPTPPAPPASAAEGGPPQVTLTADDIVSHMGGVAQARGHVELLRQDVDLFTDYIEYDQLTDTAHAQGNVRINRALDWFTADRLDLEVQQSAGTMINSSYGLGRAGAGAGGHASRIELIDRDRASAFDADYTSCPRDDVHEPDWVLSGSRIDIDTATNEGRATGAVLHFLGVPILAAPSMSFPVTSERKSGWLPPTSDFSNSSGFTIGVPYYWNYSPNVDATFTPAILTNRGAALATEVRYLEPADIGQFTLVALPYDRAYDHALTELDTQNGQVEDGSTHHGRGSFQWAHEGAHDLLSYSARVQQVSDDQYWKDFPHQMPALTQRLLPLDLQGARRFPFGEDSEYDTYARVQRWQTLQEDLVTVKDDPTSSILAPYQRSPQLGFRGYSRLGSGLRFDLEAEANRFDLEDQFHSADPTLDDERTGGARAHMIASLSRDFATTWGHIEPRLKINGATYRTDEPMNDPEHRTDASRWIPTFSTDSSFTMERDTSLFGREMVQTLEPRFQYVFTPFRQQRYLPLYDTAAKDFNEVSIYSDNDFTGVDRVADLNELTAGATTRFNDAGNGRELLRLGIAQRFLFKDQRITVDNQAVSPVNSPGFPVPTGQPGSPGVPLPTEDQPQTRKLSDLLLWGSSSMLRNWNFDGILEFNPSSNWTQRAVISTRYSPGPYRTLSATYRYARSPEGSTLPPQQQYEVAGQWPVYHRAKPATEGGCGGTLYAVGRVDYSVTDSRANYAVGGFEYDAGCWVGRLIVERTSTGRNEATTHLVLQLELIGLSTLGSGSVRVLKDNIPGYQPLHDESASAQVPRSP
jgi:LPS-assembly protein